MLRFFRRIRRKLLDQGRLQSYLTYALGEMLLVMFGILLAIQVNNFNEKRKNDQYLEGLLTALENDLIENIQDANIAMEWGIEKDSLIDLVLSNKVTEEMYASNVDLNQLIFTGYEHRVIAGNVVSLLQEEKRFPRKYSGLLPLLKKYQLDIRHYEEGKDDRSSQRIA